MVQIHPDTAISLVESMMLLRQLSYAIKTQLKAPKALDYGHFLLFAVSLWHEVDFQWSTVNQAGSRNVIELHGTNSTVLCVSCSHTQSRLSFQRVLERLNPDMVAKTDIIRPDGDVELSAEEVNNFKVPGCPKCGSGILKPSVVFFGDNVPASRVNQVRREVSQCDRLLGNIPLLLC